MIFRILKNLHTRAGDFALRTEMGDMICKAAFLKSGFYIYNKNGNQVAQLTFTNDKKLAKRDGLKNVNGFNVASLSVVTPNPIFPGEVKMCYHGKDRFSFSTNVIEKGDEKYLENIKGQQAYKFSFWGHPSEFSFDIFDGKDLVANVIPYLQDDEVYQVRVHEKGNLFFIFMLCLAVDMLQSEQQYNTSIIKRAFPKKRSLFFVDQPIKRSTKKNKKRSNSPL